MTIEQEFAKLYGTAASGVWAGPGRVNLMGEHTDYNEGFVLPFAIDRRARVAVRRRTDLVVQCASRQWGAEIVRTDLDALTPRAHEGWSAYVLAVAWALTEAGATPSGFDLLLDSDVPVGAGLSSSAAVQTATGLALADLLGLHLAPMELAKLCHRAETEFVGAPVGVMDQVASACSSEGHALLLDCRSLQSRQVRFDPAALGCALLVVDTRAEHANADGAYAERRASCQKAATDLGIAALRDATLDQVADDPRARHVVSECARVLETADALEAGDVAAVGRLLLASHHSLRDDFAVSNQALDIAVDTAMAAGAHGARLTGAGFGGCAIALVPTEAVTTVARSLVAVFAANDLRPPHVFPVQAGPGATRLA